MLIVGGGIAGIQAAITAADRGHKVTLAEKSDKLGGLLYFTDVDIDKPDLRNFKDMMIREVKRHDVEILMNTEVTPEFIKEFAPDAVILATGSVPACPPIPGSSLPGVVTSDGLLDKKDLFEHLIIIGGGVIGMEFASVYSSLGHGVTVIEALDRILPTMDKEIAQNLKMIMKKRNVEIHTGAKVEEILQTEDGKGLICRYTEKDKPCEARADGILIATGRRAYTGGLITDESSREVKDMAMERGRIITDEKYETSVPGIYAIGDVTGGIQLAHAATAQGRNAVAHMAGEDMVIRTDIIPSCVYTNPEIGCVGISADEAKARGMEAVTKKYIMSANGKSILSQQERGFIKVVADSDSHRILGAQMMCARATDMISQFAVAIANELTLEDMAKVIFPHPTFSEGILEAVR